jgi:hypothetical protein
MKAKIHFIRDYRQEAQDFTKSFSNPMLSPEYLKHSHRKVALCSMHEAGTNCEGRQAKQCKPFVQQLGQTPCLLNHPLASEISMAGLHELTR